LGGNLEAEGVLEDENDVDVDVPPLAVADDDAVLAEEDGWAWCGAVEGAPPGGGPPSERDWVRWRPLLRFRLALFRRGVRDWFESALSML
jgi:hypothetical protein